MRQGGVRALSSRVDNLNCVVFNSHGFVYPPQMRDWIFKLIIASMLFVGVEGVAESVDDGSFHQTHHAHADDSNGDWFPDSDGDDHGGDSCEHFCHLHSVGLVSQFALAQLQNFQSFEVVLAAQRIAYIAAPPTPPPNA